MNYIVYNATSGQYHKKERWHFSPATYTEKGAKMVATKLAKKYGHADGSWHYATYEDYRKLFPVKMVTRKNLMSGKEFEIADDTPACCDPSTETYWAM